MARKSEIWREIEKKNIFENYCVAENNEKS